MERSQSPTPLLPSPDRAAAGDKTFDPTHHLWVDGVWWSPDGRLRWNGEAWLAPADDAEAETAYVPDDPIDRPAPFLGSGRSPEHALADPPKLKVFKTCLIVLLVLVGITALAIVAGIVFLLISFGASNGTNGDLP